MRDNDQRRIGPMKLHVGRLAGAAALLMLFVSAATAQPYPTRQITLVVPFAPGGPLIARPAYRSEDERRFGPADRRRQSSGGEHHHRRPGGRQSKSRRLHAADGDRRHVGHESIPLQQACLRSVQGFRADLADRARALGGGRKHQHPRQLDQGTGRAGEGQARDLPDRNQHADVAGQCRASQHDGRDQFHHGSLSRRDDPNHRHSRRRRCARHGEHQRGATALARQEGQDPRPSERAAPVARPGHSNHRRDLPRIRSRHLAEHRRARGHAARRRDQAARIDPEGAGASGGPRKAAHRRHRAGQQRYAGGVRGLHPLAGRHAGQGHPGGRHEARLMMPMAARILVAAVVAMTMGHAHAQATLDADAKDYPNRAIRIIVPFPAGGPADIVARLVGQRMSEDWGQPVVVENRAGGNTAIGAQAAARSAPDGYTLFVPMDTTIVMNPLVTPNLPYDPLKDFAPITLLTKNMSLVVVRSDGPRTIKELIAKAKANPGKLNMGAGTITSRLGALQFAKSAGIDLQLVPFKGSAEIGQAVLAGTVDFALDSSGTSLPLIQSGHYRALAKYSNRPLPILPDLPSLSVAAELPGLGESSTWIALVAAAGTSAAIVDKIHREVASIYSDAAMTTNLEQIGIPALRSSSPAEFAAFIRSETGRWSEVLKESGNVKLD